MDPENPGDEYVSGPAFARELLQLDGAGKKRIQVWINSVGGYVMDAMCIYNAILKTKTKVDTYNVGIAASSSAVLFQAGRTRYMADYAKLMYHAPYGGNGGDELKSFADALVTMVASRSGKPEDDIRGMMTKDTWIGADEALASGLCDKIESSSDHNRPRMTSSDAMACWKAAAEVLNKSLPQNKIDMKKVNARLKLNPDASEDAALEAIEAIENKIKDQATELTEVKAALAEKTTAVTTLETKVTTMEAAATAETEVKNAATLEAKKTTAKVEVLNLLKNRIANPSDKVINKYVEDYIADEAGTKEVIEAIPLNGKAATVTAKIPGTAGAAKPYNMAVKMQEIAAKQGK